VSSRRSTRRVRQDVLLRAVDVVETKAPSPRRDSGRTRRVTHCVPLIATSCACSMEIETEADTPPCDEPARLEDGVSEVREVASQD